MLHFIVFFIAVKGAESISSGVFSYVYVSVRAKVKVNHGIELSGLRNDWFV